jgi:serralysin
VTVGLWNTAAQWTGAAGGLDTITNVENLTGSSLADTLSGNDSNNVIDGGSGNDVIKSGFGNDTLTGGNGNDIFVFNTGLNSSSNIDTITDFIFGADSIHLENSIFTTLTVAGTLSVSNFVTNTNGIAQDGNDYILYNTTTGALSYDADGNGAGAAIQFATLTGQPTISSADFLVI